MNMQQLLEALPTFYVYWATILIAWGLINSGMIVNVLVRSKETDYTAHTRAVDILNLVSITIGCVFLAASVFLIPQITIIFIEITLMMALWFNIFLIVTSQLTIASCVSLDEKATAPTPNGC